MSLTYLAIRLFKNGRLWYKYRRFINISNNNNLHYHPTNIIRQVENTTTHLARNPGLASLTAEARKFFVDSVLCKVSLHVNPALRDLVKRRFFFGDAGPLFALVGVSLAAGGRLNKEEDLDGICWEIRNAVSRFQWILMHDDDNEQILMKDRISLRNLHIGDAIAKGCSAVVYSAKINEDSLQDENVHVKGNQENKPLCSLEYPLALKMMFNYDIRSSSSAIVKAMYQETVPARRFYSDGEIAVLESLFSRSKVTLPPHPNIVTMYSVFADYVPQLSDSMSLYPSAMPTAYNPDGYGRNMTLFLLMKRYRNSLQMYLKDNEIGQRKSTLLFAQLLEGVAHMNMNGIAHRDLKSDNILVDTEWVEDNSVPIMVIADFGCCLADPIHGLRIPFRTEETDRGGNMALMAPEILTAAPGTFSYLDYSKSDLWAIGTIAYEIYGLLNPFWTYNKKTDKDARLRNAFYKDNELPSMENKSPKVIEYLVKNILCKNPKSRLSAEVAADVCQLYLWAPSVWIKNKKMPSTQEILEWLLCLTTKILCEGRLTSGGSKSERENFTSSKRRTHAEYLLISSFLCRVKMFNVKRALNFIHCHT